MSEEDQNNPPARRGRFPRIPEDRYAAARILYETTPGMSYRLLASKVGISERALEEKGRKEGWTKNELLPEKGLDQDAQKVADRYVGKLADYGLDVTPDQKVAAMRETAVETAVEMRAQLVERHRREWGAIRSLVYDGLRKREYGDVAKLAKISAETLQIIQSNERKAWGLTPDDNPSLTVVIERE